MSIRGLILRICTFVCLAGAAWGQATSQIQGTVQDQTGAAVPGADVKATQTDTGQVRTVMTGADGGYVIANLPLGPYRLDVSKAGFSAYAQTGIVLQVSVNPTIDVALKVGNASESVQVEANATQVETQATGVGQVLENQRILELPLNGRNPADLITLSGPAVMASTSTSRSFQGVSGGEGISVAGGTAFGTTYRLDGAMHNNPFDNFNLPLPFPDALQEFKVETSALTAQNGVHSGAAVNAVTKSGTNNIHGDAFEFLRNGVFDARNFFAASRDTLKRNQFGGTIGGPIKKNKLFFFAGFQGTTTRTAPPTNFGFVPTAAMIGGDFTAYAAAGCQGTNKVLPASLGFVNNKIPQNLLSPAAVAIASKYLPKTSDPCGKTFFGIVTAQNEIQGVGRGDYQVSDKQTMFVRYIATTYHQPIPYTLSPNVLATVTGGRDNLAQTYTFGDTYLLSPTKVNSFRAAYDRTGIARAAVDDFGPVDVGINAFSYTPHYMQISVGGGAAGGGFTVGNGTESNSNFRGNTYEIGDDLSIVHGSHQFVIGGDVAMWNSASYANVRSPGTYTFDNHLTGLVLSDFMLGALGGVGLDQAAPNTLFTRQEYLGIYGQDTWKISRRLTLNIGARWEPWFPVSVTNGANIWFSMDRFLSGTKSTVFPQAPAGVYYGGDPGFPDSGINKRWGNIAPRAGLAWDPKGDGRMTIRASWGEFYDYPNGQTYINMTISPPFGDETRTNSAGAKSLDNPWATVPGGNPFPISSDPKNALFVGFGPYLSISPNLKNTAVNSWNLTVQKQIGVPWLLTASYIGSETAHLWLTSALNPALLTSVCPLGLPAATTGAAFPAACTSSTSSRRLLNQTNAAQGKFYGNVDGVNDGGTQSYNALSMSVQRRLTRGVSFNANYTWSHCITTDRFGHGGGTMNVANTFLNPNNINYDKGPCSWDRRHIFNLSGVAQVPRFANKGLRMVASGWQAAMIVRYQSGQPLAIQDSTDNLLYGGDTTQRPNLVLADSRSSPTPCTTLGCVPYLNKAAFAVPALGVFGNLGALAVYGPSFSEIDMSISRSFRLREYLRMDIRGDAFNLPNSMRPGGSNQGAGTVTSPVNATFGAGTFGTITSSYDPRILQFSAKFVF
jgi:hypothetical protein